MVGQRLGSRLHQGFSGENLEASGSYAHHVCRGSRPNAAVTATATDIFLIAGTFNTNGKFFDTGPRDAEADWRRYVAGDAADAAWSAATAAVQCELNG